VFWKRFGTPTLDSQSGTEHEFQVAFESWQRQGHPQIMVYFNQRPFTPSEPSETEQWGRVLAFRQSFPKEGLWWPYRGAREFERLVRNHLTQFIRNYTPFTGASPTTEGELQVEPEPTIAERTVEDYANIAAGATGSAAGLWLIIRQMAHVFIDGYGPISWPF